MKILTLVARVLLGLLFIVFGLNVFLRFLPMPPYPGDGGVLMGLMFRYGWFSLYGFIEMVGGAFVLFGRYVALGLILLGAMIVNILLFHLTLSPSTIGPGVFAAILEIILLYEYRASFKTILSAQS
jgi:putative oxidoreductase